MVANHGQRTFSEEEQQMPLKLSRTPSRNSEMKVDGHEDMLYEIMKHLDARSLACAACVNRAWRQAAQDENLWEGICTMNWSISACRTSQFRSVVLALGGFKRLYALYLRPLLKCSSGLLDEPPQCSPSKRSGKRTKGWSKHEVHLSLSLFSIDYYERLGRSVCSPSSLKFLLLPSIQCGGVPFHDSANYMQRLTSRKEGAPYARER